MENQEMLKAMMEKLNYISNKMDSEFASIDKRFEKIETDIGILKNNQSVIVSGINDCQKSINALVWELHKTQTRVDAPLFSNNG